MSFRVRLAPYLVSRRLSDRVGLLWHGASGTGRGIILHIKVRGQTLGCSLNPMQSASSNYWWKSRLSRNTMPRPQTSLASWTPWTRDTRANWRPVLQPAPEPFPRSLRVLSASWDSEQAIRDARRGSCLLQVLTLVCTSAPQPGTAVCTILPCTAVFYNTVPLIRPDFQWEPRGLERDARSNQDQIDELEYVLQSWAPQISGLCVLHLPHIGPSCYCDARLLSAPACILGPSSSFYSTLTDCVADMEYTPQRPELPAPGDHRPPLPRRRGPNGPAQVKAAAPTSLPIERDTTQTANTGSARRTSWPTAPLPTPSQGGTSPREPLPRKRRGPGTQLNARHELNSLPDLPMLPVKPLHSISTELIPLYSRYGDPAVELPMDATLKQAHHPRARLLELDVGVCRLRLVDISEVPLSSVCSAPKTSGGTKPKPRAKKMPRPNAGPRACSLKRKVVEAEGRLSTPRADGTQRSAGVRKSRFIKIRGSLRECLRRRPELDKQRQGTLPPAARRRVSTSTAHASGAFVDSTEVTYEPIPCDPVPLTPTEGGGAGEAKDYDAIYKARLSRVLADERKCSLLMWQRAQFLQRAETMRMQALTRANVHTGAADNVSPVADAPTDEVRGTEQAPICARVDGAYMIHACLLPAPVPVLHHFVPCAASSRSLEHWLDIIRQKAQVLDGARLPVVSHGLFLAWNKVYYDPSGVSFFSSLAAQTYTLKLYCAEPVDIGDLETAALSADWAAIAPEFYHKEAMTVWTNACADFALDSQLHSEELSDNGMHYLRLHALCSVPYAAFRDTLSFCMPSTLFRHGSLPSTHRCHLWRVWRFRRPQSRRSRCHRRARPVKSSAVLCRLSIVHSLLQTVLLPVMHFCGGSKNATTTPTTPISYVSRLGPKSEISRQVLRPRCGFIARIYLPTTMCHTYLDVC